MEFCKHTSDLGNLGGAVGSIRFGGNVEYVTVYDEVGYNGDSKKYTNSRV